MGQEPGYPLGKGRSSRFVVRRNLVIETALCVVLLGAIIVVVVDARHDIFAGPTIIALATTIMTILRSAPTPTDDPATPGGADEPDSPIVPIANSGRG